MAHAAEPVPSASLDPQVRALMQQLLRPQIETKLIYQDARRTIPSENFPNIEQQLTRRVRAHGNQGTDEARAGGIARRNWNGNSAARGLRWSASGGPSCKRPFPSNGFTRR